MKALLLCPSVLGNQILLLLSILLVTNSTLAQESKRTGQSNLAKLDRSLKNVSHINNHTNGHIKPLPEELLQTPITLDCGVTIVENVEKHNGSLVRAELTEQDIKTLNTVCLKVATSYIGFLSTHNMGTPSIEKFHWEVSFLPDTRDYRCLNDTKYRFYSRRIQEGNVAVDGYTDEFNKLTFSLSNRNSKYFKTVFAHETFHALNYFYGIADTEKLAEDFTAQLGYGR